VIISRVPLQGLGQLMNVGNPLVSSAITAIVAYVMNSSVRIEDFADIPHMPRINNVINIKGFKVDMSHSYIIGTAVVVDILIQTGMLFLFG